MTDVSAFRIAIALVALTLLASVSQPLTAQSGGVITGLVKNAVTGAPVAKAKVSVVLERKSWVTGSDGTYRLRVDSVRAKVQVTAVGFAPVAQMVSVSSAAATVVMFELEPSAVPLDEVVTLGTRSLERTATQSAVPIDVVSAQLMENTGVLETSEQLQRLIPSVYGPHIPLFDNGMRPITLRGLAPHHSLLLINGKRRHPSSTLFNGPSVHLAGFTDLNAIPGSAIDHIEVLRDGASAQYGSDAIGGVVNVVLKSGTRRELRSSFGQVLSSEGGRTFHDGRVLDAAGTFGIEAHSGSHLTLSGEMRDRNGTNRAYPDMRQQYFVGDPRNDEPPRISSYVGDGELRDLSVFVDAAAPVCNATEIYVFGGTAYKNNLSPDLFRVPQDFRTVRAIFPNGFLPRVESDIGDVSGLVGVRGSALGWRWDISSEWGDSRVSYHLHHSNNVSLGAASPTSFYIGRVSAQQWTSNFDASRDVKVASMPVTLATGLEFRAETYQIRAGDDDSWRDGGVPILDGPRAGEPAPAGAQSMLGGFRPVDEVSPRRSNIAAYVEAEGRPSKQLLVQSALRAERYSDFGSTYDGKVAARVQLADWVAVRGSASTGFRAPSLAQEYFSGASQTVQVANGVAKVLTRHTFPVNTEEARLIGAKALRPENSVNLSAGVVVNKPSLPVVTADYYTIKIDDRVNRVSPVTDTSIIRVYEQNGLRGINAADYFANVIDTRTSGLDIAASHGFLLTRSGMLRIFTGYNHNRTLVTHVAPSPPEIAAFTPVLFNRISRGVIEQGHPRQTVTLGLNYSTGPLGLNLRNERSGPTTNVDAATRDLDEQIGAKWVTDVRASYKVHSRLEVALSATNLFDVYPTEWQDFKKGLNGTGASMKGILRYPGALSPVGENGRTLYLQLSYR